MLHWVVSVACNVCSEEMASLSGCGLTRVGVAIVAINEKMFG